MLYVRVNLITEVCLNVASTDKKNLRSEETSEFETDSCHYQPANSPPQTLSLEESRFVDRLYVLVLY